MRPNMPMIVWVNSSKGKKKQSTKAQTENKVPKEEGICF